MEQSPTEKRLPCCCWICRENSRKILHRLPYVDIKTNFIPKSSTAPPRPCRCRVSLVFSKINLKNLVSSKIDNTISDHGSWEEPFTTCWVPKVHGISTSRPSSSFHNPRFGLHMANTGAGVISCAHLRHSSLALDSSVSKAILNKDWKPNFSYNGFPILDPSNQHSRSKLSAFLIPAFMRSEPIPHRRCAGWTAIQFSAGTMLACFRF
jgi:hypothetical protein